MKPKTGTYVVYTRYDCGDDFSAALDAGAASDIYGDNQASGLECAVFRLDGLMLVDVTGDIEDALRDRFWRAGHPEEELPRWLYPELADRDAAEQYQIEAREAGK